MHFSDGWARGVECETAISALLSALREHNVMPISLLSDGEGVISGPGQDEPTVERVSRTIKSEVRRLMITQPYSLHIQ